MMAPPDSPDPKASPATGRTETRRRIPWRFIVLAAGALVVGGLAWERYSRGGSGEDRRPNLVLITIDTLRADHLGCYGYETAKTPNIDRFAASAVRFELATTVNNNTLPSHAAMLIGKYLHDFGVPRNGFIVPPKHETLATILASRGYETAAFVSAEVLHSAMGFGRGFRVYDQAFDTREYDQHQRRAPATNERALAWLKNRGEKPFFLWVHYFDPHYPYTPPEPYRNMFYPEYEGPADGSYEFLRSIDGTIGFAKVETTPDDHRKCIALYDGEIAFLDANLGELFDILDEEQHRERTLVIFTADHGESLTEHGYYFNHGLHVYQPSMHVPLIVRPPGHDSDRGIPSVAEPVEIIDVFATALAQLDLPVPEGSDSMDLTPLCQGNPGPSDALCFGESSRPWAVERQYPDQWPNIGKAQFVLDYPWKLILTPYKKRVELYRIDEDRGELVNVARAHHEVVDRLSRELRLWRERGTAPVSEMNLENMQKLRSLGYVE